MGIALQSQLHFKCWLSKSHAEIFTDVVPITHTGSSATSLAMVYVSPSKETTCFNLVQTMPDEGTKDTVCKSCFET